jgi:polysaccharide deacetylase 2 family uncharacterized protein YibQ
LTRREAPAGRPEISAGAAVRRTLAVFWGGVLLAGIVLGVTLQMLGPPTRPAAPGEAAGHRATTGSPSAALSPAARPASDLAAAPALPGSPIAPPDPTLLAPSPDFDGRFLPRMGTDGRVARHVYAAGWDRADTRPRIAILLADIGTNEQDSDEAIRGLPPAVSLAVSPYGLRGDRLLLAARARGHELLAEIPMEPTDYPMSDPGPRALLSGASAAQNALNLEWSLSRFTGYVGATGALGRMHGERYANAAELQAWMLGELASRGLLYIDPRPGAAPPRAAGMPPFRAVDVVVDAPAVRSEVDNRLAELEKRAREAGSALGLANTPTPMVVDRIAAWATSLSVRGFVLVPVSALVAPN